jgi:hypothetical protein
MGDTGLASAKGILPLKSIPNILTNATTRLPCGPEALPDDFKKPKALS